MLRKSIANLTLHWIRGNGDDKDTNPVDDSDDRAVHQEASDCSSDSDISAFVLYLLNCQTVNFANKLIFFRYDSIYVSLSTALFFNNTLHLMVQQMSISIN